MTCEIRPLSYCEPKFTALIAEAGAADGRFIFRLRDHWLDGSESYDRPGEILLGAFKGDQLVGLAAIGHDPYDPTEGLGRVRYVYVLKSFRGRGIARGVIKQLLEHGAGHFQVLRLQTSNPVAARIYESVGFTRSAGASETHRLQLQRSSTSRP